MKNSRAFWVLMIFASACAPAWSQDDQGDLQRDLQRDLQGDPSDSTSSAGALDHNPYDPDNLTRRYGAYNKHSGERYDLNPYGGAPPKGFGDEGDNAYSREEDDANPYGLEPDNSYARARPYGGSARAYGQSFDAGRRAASDLLKHYDQSGRYNDGLTTYPYDPCAVATPYEPAGEPCGGGALGSYGNPYANRSFESPNLTGTSGTYGPQGASGGPVSSPYDPSRSPQTYPRSNENFGHAPIASPGAGAAAHSAGESPQSPAGADAALKSSLDSLNLQLNRAEADLRAAQAPGLPDQLGGHNQGSAPLSEKPPNRPNSKPRDGKPHAARAAAKQKTPDQYGVHNGGSNSSNLPTARDPLAQGIHPSSSGGVGD